MSSDEDGSDEPDLEAILARRSLLLFAASVGLTAVPRDGIAQRLQALPLTVVAPPRPCLAPPVTPSAPGVPELPGRNEIIAAVTAVRASLLACLAHRTGPGDPTVLVMTLTIGASGRLQAFQFSTTPAVTLTQHETDCLSAALRRFRVTPFLRPTLTVRYPLRLR